MYLTSLWNTTINIVLPVIFCRLDIREHRISRFRPFVIIYFKAVDVPFVIFPVKFNKAASLGGRFLLSGYSAYDSQNSRALFLLDWSLLLLWLTECISFSIIGVYLLLQKLLLFYYKSKLVLFMLYHSFIFIIAHFL
jgi:hypothetical protein